MTIELLTRFFMWCTIINFGVLLFLSLIMRFGLDLAYRLQRPWIDLGQEQFKLVFYCFLGAFKLLVIVFSFVPFIVLHFFF